MTGDDRVDEGRLDQSSNEQIETAVYIWKKLFPVKNDRDALFERTQFDTENEMTLVTMILKRAIWASGFVIAASLMFVGQTLAHGDVTPQPIVTEGLEKLGDEWRTENPYSGSKLAIEIGASGYNQNCARCHGLDVISGGLSPDLRYLDLGKDGDEWFMERVRNGSRKADGTTVMPSFEDKFSQEAMWAIRAFIESKHVEDND